MSKIGTHLYGPSNVLERLVNLLIEIVQNRLKILSLELREEKIHLIQIFLMATFVMFLGVLTFVVITITVIFALDPANRLLGLIVASAVFLLVTLILALSLGRKLREHPVPFTHSLAQLKKEKS